MDILGRAFNGVATPDELFQRIATIVGGEIIGNTLNVNFQFSGATHEDARAAKAQIKTMEMELRQLRSEVVNAVQKFNAIYAVLIAEMAKQSPAHKAVLRKGQLDFRQLYEVVKNNIDNLLLQLNTMRQSLPK